MNKVFVYGTLKDGYHNNYYLRGCNKIHSTAISEDKYVLVNSGIPYAIPAEYAQDYKPLRILGEIWEVDEDSMEWLDGLEGHPDWYKREVREFVVFGEQKVKAWIYEYPHQLERDVELSDIVGECYEWSR